MIKWYVNVCVLHICICAHGKCLFVTTMSLSFFQDLSLPDNKIDSIHRFAFKGLKTLRVLDLSWNQLTSAPSLAEVESTLQKLNLKRNYIKHIKDSYFDFCMNIEYIDIGFNELKAFPSMQNIAKSIVIFGVEGNNISEANFVYGNSFTKLKNLMLGSNPIRRFCPPPGKFAPRLRALFLVSCDLSMIHFPNESHRQEVQVHLENNPWHCNGSLGWTQQCQLRDEMNNVIVCMEWLFLRDMVCESPKEARGLTPKEAGNWSRMC